MRLPVDMMRSSLRAAIQLLRSRSDVEVAIDLVQQVHDAMEPTKNALRVRKSRALSSITSNDGHGGGRNAGQLDEAARSLSEISSSPKHSESLEAGEKSRESREREASTLRVHPLDRASGQQVDRAGGRLDSGHVRAARLAGCWDGVGGVSTSGSQRARIGEAIPLIERLAKERGMDPVALFQGACDRFKADAGLKAKKMCTLPVLLSQLEQWADDPLADAAPRQTQAHREWEQACKAGEEAQKRHPGKDWDAPEMKPFGDRIAAARRALDAEREQRQALS